MSCIAPPPRRAAQQPSPNLLLVDDDPIHQLVGQRLLERLGARVEIAHNGQSALERVGLRHFDLVLMDIHMPLMDGVTATRAIRAAGLRKLPIVAMTTRAGTDDEREYARAGMNDLVPKPVDARDLARAVSRWLPPVPRRSLAQIQRAHQTLEESLHSLIEQLLPQLTRPEGILA